MPALSAERLTSPAPLNERAFRLFTYLRELTALNLTRVLDLADYDTVLWFSDLPESDACYSISSGIRPDGDSDLWMDIKKLAEPVCPKPPAVCEGWYSPNKIRNSDNEPSLFESVQLTPVDLRTGDPARYTRLEEHPDIASAWATYLVGPWRLWSASHKRWKKHHSYYSSLFTLEQQIKRLGEAYELVAGFGLLMWLTPNNERIRRHIVVAQVSLKFDPQSGTISLRPSSEGARPILEYDMLDPDLRPPPDVIKSCEIQVATCDDELWPQGRLSNPLRCWVNSMSDRGSLDESVTPPQTITSHPVVSFAPAIILRRRNRRSLLGLLQGIAERLKASAPVDIPFGVQRLCEIVGETDASADVSGSSDSESGNTSDGEIYFPLPSNEEQRLIVKRLRKNRGVLVQGPPGTGKSQTIANLICHLLAEGKRILVTSQTERALKVLQGKLPRELQPLCVTVLGADETALRNMETSVLGINERNTQWEPERNAAMIKKLETEVKAARAAKATAEARLRQLREIEFQEFVIVDGRYHGTAGSIARRLESERDQHGWIPDAVHEQAVSPLRPEELRQFHATLLRIPTDRRQECMRSVCLPTKMPSTEQFIEFARSESDARSTWDSYADARSSDNARTLFSWSVADRQSLRAEIDNLRTEIAAARHMAPDWVAKALHDVLSGRAKLWLDLLTLNEAELRKVGNKFQRALSRELHIPANRDRRILYGDASALLSHLNEGGSMGFWLFRANVVRQTIYITREVRVNGRLCDDTPGIAELVEHLTVERSIDLLWENWAMHVQRAAGPLRYQVSELEQNLEHLRRIKTVSMIGTTLRTMLKDKPGIAEPVWTDDAAVCRFLQEIRAAEARRLLADAQAAFDDARRQLEHVAASQSAHSSVSEMLKALIARDAKAFSAARESTLALLADREEWSRAIEMSSRLRQAAPQFASALESDPKSLIWTVRIEGLNAAWDWSRAQSWLHEFLHGKNVDDTEDEVRMLETKIAHTLAELAAAKAWRHCLSHLTEEQSQHMISWYQAIKKIGKGTGVRADIHRSNARAHMDKCRSAIPAWIMPFYRVAETVGDRPELYDVVIVDEASQSGPEACALLYMAKRCIIVGDDKQISPDAVGIVRAQVDQLMEQYLHDIEIRDSFDVESSLFSQAQIRFGGGRVRLKEHFRCMPEIIRFSNDLCYRDEPLLPLRQFQSKRLDPIVVRHVANGFREGEGGRVRNLAEATAIAEAIVACANNPAYSQKTMGVISLLGEEQANLIRGLVIARLDAREMEKRELTFGDAYTFQGDERDVIFLSMVAAPNVRNATLADKKAERRFNVATSRARDQVWLFHSVTTADLNTADIRHRLLSYYLNPEAPPPLDPDWAKCESKFESIVGRIIHERGYRVIPQFEPFGPGGKRLDFVVEGSASKLAVECDGDEYHSSPEQIHDDLVRQRQLERCQWTFWRLRASEFYANREKAMTSLWRKLADLDIRPRSINDVATEPPHELPPVEASAPLSANDVAALPPQTGAPVSAASPSKPITVPRVFADGPRQDELPLTSPTVHPPRTYSNKLEGIEKLLLEQLAVPKRIETGVLILETMRRLGLRQDNRYIVEGAIRQLEKKGLVTVGVNYVGKKDTYS